MNAMPLFFAFVNTCLLSLAEPIYGSGRYPNVEHPPSPDPDGLQLAVTDVTPPLPPFNTRVMSRSSGGKEITWDAEAGFESGIGGFFARRNNRGLARLLPAMTPPVVYGRRFQGLSYHDTPEGPQSEKRHLDASAKPGAKHTDGILTVNSAGVPSEPSTGVSVPRQNPERSNDHE